MIAERRRERSATFIDALVARYGLDLHARATPVALRRARLRRAADLPAGDGRGRALPAAARRSWSTSVWPRTAWPVRRCCCASPAARTAARDPTSPRSRSSARRRVATTCTSAATARGSASTRCTARTSTSRRSSRRWTALFARYAAERAAGEALRRLRLARGPGRGAGGMSRGGVARMRALRMGSGPGNARAGRHGRGQQRPRAHERRGARRAGRWRTCRARTRCRRASARRRPCRCTW